MKRFTLEQKGFVVIGLPLLIQLVTVSFLVTILFQARANYLREAKINDVARIATVLPQALLQCGHQCVSSYFFKDTRSTQKATQSVKRLNRLSEQLLQAADGDPDLMARVARMEQASHALIQEFSNYNEEISRPDRIVGGLDRLGMLKRLNAGVNILLAEATAITEIQRQEQTREWQLLSQEQAIIALVVVALTLNVLTAMATAWFFNRDISRRLQIICANVERIGRHQQLLTPLGGGDELTTLDNYFHKMARALDYAGIEKRQFVELFEERLREPLINFKGAVSRIGSGAFGALTDQGLARLSGSKQSAQRLIALLSELIDIENLESGQIALRKSQCLPRDLFSETIGLVQELATAQGCLIKIDAPHNSAVYDFAFTGDFERLVRVLTNILANAIKFSYPGKPIILGCMRADEELIFSICNQGKVIPSTMKNKVFARFEQVDQSVDTSKQAGTGLGLYISREIVEAHGGKIWFESNEQAGTTFFFAIPY